MAATQERQFLYNRMVDLEQQVSAINLEQITVERLPEIESSLKHVEKCQNRFLELHHDICKRAKTPERVDAEAVMLNEFLTRCHNSELKLETCLQKLQPKTTDEKSTKDHSSFHMLMKSMFDQQNTTMSEIMGTHRTNMETVASSIKNQATTPKRRMKLPQVQLPPFSGKLSEWQPYHDLFVSMIHNNDDYALEEKFFYLKTSLTGEAAATIKHLPPTEANYKDAWELLVGRYNKPRNIVFDYIKTFFAQSKKAATNPTELRQSFNTFEEVTRAVDALKTSSRDAWLIYIALDALDPESQSLWARTPLEGDIPTWDEFLNFLEKRCDAWATCWDRRSDNKPTKSSSIVKPTQSQRASQPASSFVATVDETKSCPVCTIENHSAFQCPQLLDLSPAQRLEKIKASRLCFNCLRGSHGVRECRSSWCRKCNAKHNTLLHEAFVSANATPTVQSQPENTHTKKTDEHTDPAPNTLVNHVVAHIQGYKYMMLPTVQLLVTGRDGRKHTCRALLDSCSQTNTMTRKFAGRLGLPLKTSQVSVIKGIGAASTNTPQSVNAEIEDRNGVFSMILDFLVIEHITDDQPTIEVKMPYEIPSYVTLADPDFNKPGRIDILLGAEVFMNALRNRKIAGSPTLLETVFGYIVGGSFQSQLPSNATSHLITCLCATEDTSLHNELEKFWNLEEVPSRRALSAEEQKCEEHFINHTHRNPQGRYVVRMPTRENIHELGESRQMAERRFHCVERRLQRNESLYTQYKDFMRQYEDLGHMRKIPQGYTSSMPPVYLCHHPVIKESITTPVRVVFDASAKTSSGLSLNSALMVGAKTQDDLFDILLRFRQYNVIIKADIQKMYRQIEIQENDQGMLRILWRETSTQPLETYLLSTVTYGTACAPFLATRCLKQLVIDEGKHFATAAPVVEKDFYVDDLLTGTSDPESALILVQELIAMLQRGGFVLKKWSSNSREVMSQIPAEDHDLSSAMSMDHEEGVKTLGLYFNSNSDFFRFLTTEFHSIVTRRSMLSDTAKTYDPLGLLSPITVTAKILMQSLWSINAEWDSPVPDHVYQAWMNHQNNLKEAVNSIKIPRQITSIKNPQTVQLFGFCDASQRAYAACVYARVTDSQNNVTSRLLCAKTKVAPRKQVSLPRLELCGAQLLARLLKRVQNALTITINGVHAFTDSTIVLCWINAESQRWKTFVANRVARIQDVVPPSNWHHVVSQENPADLATRGVLAAELTEDSMWFKGPSWITDLDINFQTVDSSQVENIHLEIRNTTSLVSTSSFLGELIGRYSSFTKLVRCVAYWQRFITNRLRKVKKMNLIVGHLTPAELSHSRTFIVRQIQRESFSEDYQHLSDKREVSKGSRILNLNPFFDEKGLMRVGGRIRHADAQYDFKHPVILPSHHHLTHLIALDAHNATLHGGTQKTLAYLRRRYWPLRGIDVAKKVIRECVTCFKVRPTTAQQIMSDCHISRVSAVHPFHRTGVDFCGPFLIRTPVRSKTRLKMYVALFVCLATRAVHIELVTDLTSAAFIASLRRFAARRGRPAEILCDNATNFVGANRELRELQRLLDTPHHQSEIIDSSANQGIEFKFIPPRSPHFGGSWESLIKGVKYHLNRTVGNSHLTEEEMLTILAQIEGCLNSRPITPMSADPSDLEVLTPGHFLIGRPLDAIPDEDLSQAPENRLKAWKLVQQRLQFFWNRWSNEYLHTLQQRRKWTIHHPSLKPGDLVTVKEDHLPPLKWSLGRVVECFPGADGNVRVASIRTSTGIYRRAIAKLCPLPLEMETQKSSLLPGQDGEGQV